MYVYNFIQFNFVFIRCVILIVWHVFYYMCMYVVFRFQWAWTMWICWTRRLVLTVRRPIYLSTSVNWRSYKVISVTSPWEWWLLHVYSSPSWCRTLVGVCYTCEIQLDICAQMWKILCICYVNLAMTRVNETIYYIYRHNIHSNNFNLNIYDIHNKLE